MEELLWSEPVLLTLPVQLANRSHNMAAVHRILQTGNKKKLTLQKTTGLRRDCFYFGFNSCLFWILLDKHCLPCFPSQNANEPCRL